MAFQNFTTERSGSVSNTTIIDVDRIAAIIPENEGTSSLVLVDGEWIPVETSPAEVIALTGRAVA